jgi:ketosteroid isomerase-like protein
MVRTLSCWLLLGVVLVGTAAAQKSRDDSQETKLLVMEHLWNEAQLNRDSRALDGLIATNFVNTEYDGEVSDKGKFLADIKDPHFNLAALTIQDLKVNMYADSAVVVGTYRTRGSYQGKPYEHVGRFTDTWVFTDGRWQCVASHTSLLKK